MSNHPEVYSTFLKEIAPYVVVVGSFGRHEEHSESDIDCFLRSRPRADVDPEQDNETYMPEILSILDKYNLDWSSVLVGHIAVERQPGFPRMVEISSHYRIQYIQHPFYRDVDGIRMLCARDNKECAHDLTYDHIDWDDNLGDCVIRHPLPAFRVPLDRSMIVGQGEFSMNNLSEKSLELFQFLQTQYIDSGYSYSGSWPANSLFVKGYTMEDIEPLVNAKLIQKRDCDAYAYELTADERAKLIDAHNLGQAWQSKGTSISTDIRDEINCVMKERSLSSKIEAAQARKSTRQNKESRTTEQEAIR